MNTEHKIYLLFGKKMAGRITAQELQQLHNLIARNPHLHYSLELLHDVWNQRPPNAHPSTANQFQAMNNERQQQPVAAKTRMSFSLRIVTKVKHCMQWIAGAHSTGMQKNLL